MFPGEYITNCISLARKDALVDSNYTLQVCIGRVYMYMHINVLCINIRGK